MPTMTAAALREREKIEYNAFLSTCPSRDILSTISDKWIGLTLEALADGPQRYADIARQIAGVSPKMLTQTLRSLERNGLATRTVTASVPVRVDYELTELGTGLRRIMHEVKLWSEGHIDQVRAAREEYDAAQA